MSLSFTIHVSREQAERWEEAAAVQGPTPVESWLVSAADAYLQELVRSGRLASLEWFWTRFRLPVKGRGEVEVRGEVFGPFGIFRGDSTGPGEPGCCRHSLVHLPTRRIIATLPLRKSSKALAAELALLRINWQEQDPEKLAVGSPDQEKAQTLLRLFQKLTRT